MKLREFLNKSQEKKITWKHKMRFAKYFYYLAFPTTIHSIDPNRLENKIFMIISIFTYKNKQKFFSNIFN